LPAAAGGQAAHAGLGAERRDRRHQIQGGPHGPFGIFFRRHRGAPHGHHRIADELLDHPAVAADDRARDAEVPGQQLADRLRVPGPGQLQPAAPAETVAANDLLTA
jgi:hypothetical protein